MAHGPSLNTLSLYHLSASSVVVHVDDYDADHTTTITCLRSRLHLIWERLKESGSFHLTALIEEIEDRTDSPHNPIALFRNLAQQFHLRMERCPAHPASFDKLFEEEALQTAWRNKLASKFTFTRGAPRTLWGIKNWLSSQKNTVQLQAVVKLELSDIGLKVIPPHISKLTQLEFFSIGGNQVRTLPDWIGSLTALRCLYLNENMIAELPDSIGRLPRLAQLYVSFDRLKTITISLDDFPQLTDLSIVSNELTALPQSLFRLTQLTDLHAAHNKIERLPAVLGRLTQLTDLYLGFNQIASLPFSIGNLTLLVSLDLRNNQLQEVPASLGSLVHVSYLRLDSNRLETVPDFFRNFTRLEYLYLGNNRLQAIPPFLGSLPLLEHLSLGGNQIVSIPESFGNLAKLQFLDIHGNLIRGIPDTLAVLGSLEYLYLSQTQMRFIASALDKLKDNPLLFVYEKEALPRNVKEIISQGSKFNRYACQSAFARFCKAISLRDEIDERAFKELKPSDRSLIHEMAGVIAEKKLEEGQVFEDTHVFYHAVRKAIAAKFERLSPQQVEATCKNIASITGNPEVLDIFYRPYTLFENVLVLIDAMDSV